MQVTAVGGAWAAVAVVFVACSSDQGGGGAKCGPGTELSGGECVVSAGGGDDQGGSDVGGSNTVRAGSSSGATGGEKPSAGSSGIPTEVGGVGGNGFGGASEANGGAGGAIADAGAAGTGEGDDEPLVTSPLDCGSRDVTGATVLTGIIGQDATWSGVVHLPSGISVHNEPTITIEPGTKIIVGSGAAVEFGFQGSQAMVRALGTVDKPILFCGETANAGYYAGVVFRSGVKPESVLRNVLIADAGVASGGGLTLEMPLTVRGVQVRNSGAYGVLAAGYGPTSSTLIVSGAAKSSVLATASPGLSVPPNSTLTGNAVDAIDIGFRSFDGDATLSDHGVPYRALASTSVGTSQPHVGIGPGVDIQVGPQKTLDFGAAQVQAIGTAQKPILVRGLSCKASPQASTCAGHPERIQQGGQVRIGGALPQVLEYVAFEGLGWTGRYDVSPFDYYTYGAVVIRDRVPLKLNHVSVTGAIGWGLDLGGPGGLSADSEAISADATQGSPRPAALVLDCTHLNTLPADTVVSGAGTSVTCNQVATPLNWPKAGSPFFSKSIRVTKGGGLTFAPGSRIYFSFSSITVESGGALMAVGSPDAPIVFSDYNGRWGGLYFAAGSTATLDYVTVTGGGDDTYANTYPSNITAVGPIALTHSTISDSYGWGLRKSASDATDYTVTNTFENNASADIVNLP